MLFRLLAPVLQQLADEGHDVRKLWEAIKVPSVFSFRSASRMTFIDLFCLKFETYLLLLLLLLLLSFVVCDVSFQFALGSCFMFVYLFVRFRSWLRKH